MTNVIAIFDIGKTNKKLLLFDANLKPVFRQEENFPEISDEDGFPCDDFEIIRTWMFEILNSIILKKEFNIKAINFSTYGASLAFLDASGKMLTPVFNYLKPMPEGIAKPIYQKHGGIKEFCRKTASPSLGFLNSGLQPLWLKKTKPEVFNRVESILHLPQYMSYLFTGKSTSDYTSIGCHTAMWDFDLMKYHPWVKDEGIHLPQPERNIQTCKSHMNEFPFMVGIGIHDSSASLAPYILQCKEEFLLVSTGTWCINMNPFNNEPLTNEQLENDCLSYLSISQKPVKSSRLFMGHIHDVNLERIRVHFNVDIKYYQHVKSDEVLIKRFSKSENCFFRNGLGGDYVDKEIDLSQFASFEEAYHRLIVDLTDLNVKSINYILPKNNSIQNIYISGGFAKNEIFVKSLAARFKNKRVFTSHFDNSSALGAALVIYREFGIENQPFVDLGLKEWSGNR